MTTTVNAGSRLDRLPICAFHRRVGLLVGIGMFFDGFDIYLGGSVLGAALKAGFSTLTENAAFVSATFVGMMLGAFVTGFLGDRFGRRFSYQFNLMLFGLASLAAAAAPNMAALIACRFVMGIGLGAEIVVGYATITELVPARSRGRWVSYTALYGVAGLPMALLAASVLIPQFGWRAMFVLGGVGALIVWYLRKSLPESPRWLESVGRAEQAEALMQSIEREAAQGRALPPAAPPTDTTGAKSTIATLFAPPLLSRMIVGATCLITINTLVYGFVTWLPVFFVQQGLSIATSFSYSLTMALGAPVGAIIAALTSDHVGRKPTIIGASLLAAVIGAIYPRISDPAILPAVGFALTVPIYVLVVVLFGIYIPELFPTEVRLRASGIVGAIGRAATIVTPFIVVSLFGSHGISGVMTLMIGALVVQSLVVLTLGVEPRRRSLEALKHDVRG